MEFKKIGENKYQVTLSAAYLREHHIEIRSLHPESAEFQDLLKKVLDHASDQIGGRGLGRRIVVDSRGDEQGNWIVTITQVENFEPGSEAPRPMPKSDRDDPARALLEALSYLPEDVYNEITREIPPSKYDDVYVFMFEDFESLLGACSHCPNPKIIPSKLYVNKNKYYLSVKMNEKNYNKIFAFESVCKEYRAKKIEGAEIIPVLIEHGKVLFNRGAIPALLRKFEV